MNYLFLLVSIFSQALFLVDLQSSSINLENGGEKSILQEKKAAFNFIECIQNDFEILSTDAKEVKTAFVWSSFTQEEHEYIEVYAGNHMIQKAKKSWNYYDKIYLEKLNHYCLINLLAPDCENKVFWEYCVENLNIQRIEFIFCSKKYQSKADYFDKNVLVSQEIIEKFCESFNCIINRHDSFNVFIAILSNSPRWTQPLTCIKNIDNMVIHIDGDVIDFYKIDLLKMLYEKNILEDPAKKKEHNNDHEITKINDIVAKVDEKGADINKENNNHDTIDNNFNETEDKKNQLIEKDTLGLKIELKQDDNNVVDNINNKNQDQNIKDDSKKTKSFLEKLKQKQRIIIGSFFVFALVCYFFIKNPAFYQRK